MNDDTITTNAITTLVQAQDISLQNRKKSKALRDQISEAKEHMHQVMCHRNVDHMPIGNNLFVVLKQSRTLGRLSMDLVCHAYQQHIRTNHGMNQSPADTAQFQAIINGAREKGATVKETVAITEDRPTSALFI